MIRVAGTPSKMLFKQVFCAPWPKLHIQRRISGIMVWPLNIIRISLLPFVAIRRNGA